MNNIQLTCSGNCFTKPLMCWSLLDYMCVIGLVIAIGVIVFVILDKKKAINNQTPRLEGGEV